MPHYATAVDFRKALLVRLSRWCAATGWEPNDAARAFALQQLTCRLFRSDSRRSWILKGGTALQYRSSEARPTTDVDVAFAADASEIRETLESALEPSDGEYGTFEVTVTLSVERGQHRVRVAYLLGGKVLTRASLDVNTVRSLTVEPDLLTPTPFVSMPDVAPPPPMRIYPVAQHLADKLAAMYELHGSDKTTPSTRPHDLADIVILARSSTVHAGDLITAIRREEQRRGITVPSPLTLPNSQWNDTYGKRVSMSSLPSSLHDVRTALATANEFLQPILAGKIVIGRWNPDSMNWSSSA